VTDDPEEWSDFPHYTVLPANASLDNINLNLAKLQASVARNTSTGSSNTTLDTQETLQNTRCIDGQLVGWGGILPLSWFPIRVTGDSCIPPSTRQAGLYQTHCHVYLSVSIVYLWNRQRISRVRAQTIILTQLSLQEPSPSNYTSQAACEHKIQQLADDICASIPFYLGDRTRSGKMGDRNV
jgi:hypothetical protein